MTIYDFLDYKAFLAALMATFPKKGRGLALKLSEHLGVHSVVISQILKGSRHFTPEQGLATAQFFGLDERGTDYFLVMIAKDRAGTHQLAQYQLQKLKKLQAEQTTFKSQVVKARQLTEVEKAKFYSNWFYSGIRMLTSIEGYNTIDELATYFKLSRAKVRDVVNFLVEVGLCIENNGKINMGPAATFLEPTSPFANSHRRNWRAKGMEKMTEPGENDLFYTSPMSLSEADIKILKKEIAAFVGTISKRVSESPCEKLACFNLDFFEF